MSAGTTVSLAQLRSRFQAPQPPIDWRVQPLSGVAHAGAARERRPVGLGDDLVLRRAVARLGHRLAHALQRAGDVGGLGRLPRRGEARGHGGVVAAVVLQPRRRRDPVGHAALEDRGEAVVVGPDHHGDGLDVVRARVLLQRQRLSLAARGVRVEVDAGLEVLARAGAAGARLRSGAGEVGAQHAAADVRLRGLGAVAALDRLAAPRVAVGARAERVDARGGLVGVAGPAPCLTRDGRVPERHDGRRPHAGPVRGGGRRQRQPEYDDAQQQPHDRPHERPLPVGRAHPRRRGRPAVNSPAGGEYDSPPDL